MTDLNSYK